MAKKLDTLNLIDVEIKKLESKVNEFQQYLQQNHIVAQVTKGSEILLSEENQDKLHKEILIQIKMQSALFEWLPLLRKLRESETGASFDARGGVEINGLYKKNKN